MKKDAFNRCLDQVRTGKRTKLVRVATSVILSREECDRVLNDSMNSYLHLILQVLATIFQENLGALRP